MKILSIELIDYKRLSLTNIRRLYVSFIEKVIFILGTNGSGKSSLLKELSALPAQSAQFEKTGSKVIHIEHLGFYYVLTSDFSINKHRFLKIQKNKDGVIIFEEELNPGGTQTVQRDLVKKEFGITQELHDLFTGLIKFHRMSVSERRKWFTLFSKSDYTYALEIYQKFKDSLRDAQVNLKMVQSRTVQERDKILSAQQISEIQEVLNYIEEEISNLKQKQKDFYDSRPSESLLNQLFTQARQSTALLNKKMFEYQRKRGQRNLNSEEVKSLIAQSQRKIDELQVLINIREKDLQNLQNISLQLKKNSNLDTANLKRKLEYFEKSKEKIISELVLLRDTAHNDFLKIPGALELVEQPLIDIFQTVQKDPQHFNTRDSYLKIKENIDSDRKKLDQLLSQSNQLKLSIERFEHSKEHNQTQCPNCQYVWIRNYNENDDIRARKLYQELQDTIIKTQENIQVAENKLLQMNEFFEKHRSYYQIVYHYNILKPLWDEIKRSDYLFSDPTRLTVVLENFKLETKNALKLIEINEEIKELSKLIETIEKSLIDSNSDLNSKINEYEKQVSLYLKEQRYYKQQLSVLTDIEKLLFEIQEQKHHLINTVDTIDKEKIKWLNQNMRLYIQS
jgi:energy-coupling factor transporter ATP-binding protein EcfA2